MREKVKLLSTAGTGHFYVATKNKRLHPDKMNVKKYDPVVRKHVDVQGIEDQVSDRAAGAQSTRPRKRPRQSPAGPFSLPTQHHKQSTIVGSGGWQSAGGFDSSQNLGRRRNRE